jgi:hypothetical protein
MLWRLLHHFNIHLHMEFATIPSPRERDQVVMELIFGKVLDRKTIRSLSKCRGSLEIIFLSNMTTADGRYLEQFVFDPGSKVARSKYKFPRESPAKKNWDAWFNFWHDYTATGDKLHTPLGAWIAPTGYGIITAQPMTYTESKRGKFTTTCAQQIIDAQGCQHLTI